MKFGPVDTSDAEGAILAHSLRVSDGRLRKGLRLEAAHLTALRDAGVETVTVARLDKGDLHEDEAARELASAFHDGAPHLHLTEAFTGRVNLIADGPGLVRLEPDRINAANAVHPMITIATVPDFQQMRPKGMVATVKIISYAVPGEALRRAANLVRGAIRLLPPVHARASLIVSDIPGGAGDKGADAIAARVEALGMAMAENRRCPHDEAALAEALGAAQGDIVLILTGSATSDAHDTAPAALRRAGGVVKRFGMPVDPGNLLFIGELAGKPVIGLPGCARSPALNGADWVLGRIACGIAVGSDDIAGMGVGGLLKEIPTRPMPRRGSKP